MTQGAGHIDAFIPAAHYPVLTPLYELLVRPFSGRIWKRIAREASLRSPKEGMVIDLGCGPGTVLRHICRLRPDLHLTGTDIDPAMIHIAQHKTLRKSITFEVTSIEKQPLPDRSCDVAVSSLMFHHLPLATKLAAIAEVKRILKSNGAFLLCDFSVPRRTAWWLSATFWKHIEPEIIPQLEGELFTLAKEAGASIETLQTFYGCISLHLLRFPSQP